jgi:hypothetical protein
MSPFGRFSCRVCGASFHPLDGGICPRCHSVLCADHFEASRRTVACRGCSEDPKAGGRAAGRLLQYRKPRRAGIG